MSKIIIVKGNPKVATTNEIVLNGDEQYILGVDNLYDEKDEQTLTWKIYDAKDIIVKEKPGKWNEKLIIKIDKRLCGDYRYRVEAILKEKDGTIAETNTIKLGGYCEPKILSYRTDIPNTINPEHGINANFEIEAEGLNGNILIPELWFSDTNYLGYSTSAECIEGKAQSNITYLCRRLPNIDLPKFDSFKFIKSHSYSLSVDQSKDISTSSKFELKAYPALLNIKVKDATGVYLKTVDGDDFILNLNLLSEPRATNMTRLPPLPSNKATGTISASDKVDMEVNGILDLSKIQIDTTFDVCGDEVKDFDDYENFWILKDKLGTAYYHWLRKSNTEDADVEDVKDSVGNVTKYAKLSILDNIIPITLHGNQNFNFTAKFEVVLPFKSDEIEIKVNRKDELDPTKYIFTTIKKTPLGSLNKGDELVVEFEASNTPYKDTIQYFEKFELFFEYSFDGKTWVPLKKAYFRLYLTWKQPLWDQFHDTGTPTTTMQIECKATSKNCILETLLWLGCKDCKGLGKGEKIEEKNEEKILDSIFVSFKNRIVKRVREGKYIDYNWDGKGGNPEGLGYWRGNSDSTHSFPRVLRSLFKIGEVRCGEWTQFLSHLCLLHRITNIDTVAIAVDDMSDGKINAVIEKRWGEIEKKQKEIEKLQGDLKIAKTSEKPKIEAEIKAKQAQVKNIRLLDDSTIKASFKAYLKETNPGVPNASINTYIVSLPISQIDDSLYIAYKDRKSGGNRAVRDQIEKKKDPSIKEFDLSLLLIKDCELIEDKTRTDTLINGLTSKAQGNDDAVNVFGDHIWFRHRSSMRFYDPSYGVDFDKSGSTLENYCEELFSGLCFSRSLKTGEKLPSGKSIKDLYIRHYKSYLLRDKLIESIMNNSSKSENMDVYLHTTKVDT